MEDNGGETYVPLPWHIWTKIKKEADGQRSFCAETGHPSTDHLFERHRRLHLLSLSKHTNDSGSKGRRHLTDRTLL